MSGETYLCEVCRLLIEPVYRNPNQEVRWATTGGSVTSTEPSPHWHKPKGEK